MCSAAQCNEGAITASTDGEIEHMPKHCSLEEQKNLKIVFESLLEDQRPVNSQLTCLFRGYHMKIVLSPLRGGQHATVRHKGVGTDQLSLLMESCLREHGADLLAQGKPGWPGWTTAGC